MSDRNQKTEMQTAAGVEQLFASMRAGDSRSLARAISLVEDGAPGSTAMLDLCNDGLRNGPRALRVGVAGPAGAGKTIETMPVKQKPGIEQSNSAPVLDHLGIAVRSLSAACAMYEALGVSISSVEEIAHEQVRVAMLATGQSRIELLESTTEDSVIGRYIAKRGEGLHHIALRVANLEETVKRLRQTGIKLVSETIQIGAGGHRYVFIHPASANGVLLELVDGGSH